MKQSNFMNYILFYNIWKGILLYLNSKKACQCHWDSLYSSIIFQFNTQIYLLKTLFCFYCCCCISNRILKIKRYFNISNFLFFSSFVSRCFSWHVWHHNLFYKKYIYLVLNNKLNHVSCFYLLIILDALDVFLLDKD